MMSQEMNRIDHGEVLPQHMCTHTYVGTVYEGEEEDERDNGNDQQIDLPSQASLGFGIKGHQS
jgi:hypothetical protein